MEAKDEFDEAADWYEQRRPGLGTDFVARVGDVLQRIAANPKGRAAVYQDVRKAVVTRFPYIVLYREDQGEVIVINPACDTPEDRGRWPQCGPWLRPGVWSKGLREAADAWRCREDLRSPVSAGSGEPRPAGVWD